MEITSLENKKIKLYFSLKESKNRKKEGLFLVEGEHLVKEALKENLLVDLLLLENVDISGSFSKTIVTESIMKKLSNLNSIPKMMGVCRIIDDKKIIGNRVLILDGVQDPGNLGTLIRSSCAFSFDTIILSNDSVDVYNEKVLRSTQGMLFHQNIFYDDLELVIKKLKNDGYIILGTDVVNGCDVENINDTKVALILGNEGNGVRENIKNLCDKNLYIKMNNKCESLNVGVAGSILMYELRGKDE